MKFATLFVAALLVSAAYADDEVDESAVIVGTTKNFQPTLDSNEFVLVEFYAPWCGHCKQLQPEYAAAAKTLETEGVNAKLMKVDATAESALGSKFDVKGYPTLKFFRSGKPTDYEGPREAAGIVNWLKKKTGPPATELKTADEATKFVGADNVNVVGFFANTNGDDYKAFTAVAGSNDDYTFAFSTDAAVATAAGSKLGEIVLNKPFDEKKAVYSGESNEAALGAWVSGNALRLVTPFSQEEAPKLFGSDIKTHVIVFCDDDDWDEKYKEGVTNAAKASRGKTIFVLVPEDKHAQLGEFFGVKKEMMPKVASIVDMAKKYHGEGNDLSEAAVTAFAAKVLDGTAPRFFKTEEPPATQGDVKIVVGKNFKELVLDNDKDVLLEFYAPWCGHCKSLEPIYNKLARKLSHVETLVIAKVDSTANEIDGVDVQGFPTLKFWPGNKKGDAPVDYDGARTVKGFKKYLRENAFHKFSAKKPKKTEL